MSILNIALVLNHEAFFFKKIKNCLPKFIYFRKNFQSKIGFITGLLFTTKLLSRISRGLMEYLISGAWQIEKLSYNTLTAPGSSCASWVLQFLLLLLIKNKTEY